MRPPACPRWRRLTCQPSRRLTTGFGEWGTKGPAIGGHEPREPVFVLPARTASLASLGPQCVVGEDHGCSLLG